MPSSNNIQYLNHLLDCCARRRGGGVGGIEAGVGEKVGVVSGHSCESNYVFGNVIICDE